MALKYCPCCGADVAPGYDHCPLHLSETEVVTVEDGTAERLMNVYQTFYEETLMGNADDCYIWCARGYEIASRFTNKDGEMRFHLVLAD